MNTLLQRETSIRKQFSGELLRLPDLKQFTSWKIGGPADFIAIPESVQQLGELVTILNLQQINWLLIGHGTNILFSDPGYRGVIIKLGSPFSRIESRGTRIHAGAHASLRRVAQAAADNQLTGLEPLSGIPGTIGAAVCINAGAYGASILDVVESVHGVHRDGTEDVFSQLNAQYRESPFPPRFIVTDVTVNLTPDQILNIRRRMDDFELRRRTTQPVHAASAGCTFKNPRGTGAGRLIDELGFKGYRLGSIQVSPKHANFLINHGAGTAEEVKRLISMIYTGVRDRFEVELELEVKIYNEDGSLWAPEVLR